MNTTSPPSSRATHRPDVAFHATLLAVASGIITLACILQIRSDQRVEIPLLNIPLPGICTYQSWFGVACPGCGLTRCFISLAHGDLFTAWHFNPAGLLGFTLVATQIPYRLVQLSRVRRGRRELQWSWLGQTLFWSFFAILIAQWLWRTIL